jgi:hypothetical protein
MPRNAHLFILLHVLTKMVAQTLSSTAALLLTTCAGNQGTVPTGATAGTVRDTGIGSGTTTESRTTEVTGVYVPVVPVEVGDTTTETHHHSHSDTHHETHHEREKKPMGEKVKEHIPGEATCIVNFAVHGGLRGLLS